MSFGPNPRFRSSLHYLSHLFHRALACLLLLPGLVNAGDFRLAPIFQEHMVLQRDQPLWLWGEGAPGEKVDVQLREQKKTGTVDADGSWQVLMEPETAGGPLSLEVKQGAEKIVFSDILIGDVWLCSGQSNMEWQVRRSSHAEQTTKEAHDPQLRLYTQPQQANYQPVSNMEDTGGKWVPCSPESVPNFSAVGYFFGQDLRKKLDVPIGLIDASVGATKIQAWMSREAMQSNQSLKARLAKFDELASDPEVARSMETYRRNWERSNVLSSEIHRAPADPWMLPSDDSPGWTPLETTLPGSEASTTEGPESILMDLRRTVKIPPEWSGKDVEVLMMLKKGTGLEVFWNGQKAEYISGSRANPLWVYRIPGSQMQAGEGVLALRCFVRQYDTGWLELFQQSALGHSDSKNRLPLTGSWMVRVTERFPFPSEPTSPNAFRRTITGTFNAMIHPLMPFGIKGVIWYQGESDSHGAGLYRLMLPLLIQDWRQKWGLGDFPFLIVQLPNRGPAPKEPSDPAPWALFREAQAAVAREVPHCGVAVTIDIGVADDLHPPNKQDFGGRLALTALGVAYGQDIPHQGPEFRALKIEGNQIRISFDHAEGLSARQAGPIHGFAIAGDDKTFHWAEAKIEGNEVVVSASEVLSPVAVRYAWSNNPENAILVNRQGLPAQPFRSDQW